ncbi:MAG: hypothetical protein B7X08_04595 [Acidocella sp. 20-63-7]|nr:MAG: hypothetical protein B7X08_04595 [Acidocella sp. 20-63-7]
MNAPGTLIMLAVVSALLVYWDARLRGEAYPLGWAGAVFLFWIVALPVYLVRRVVWGRGKIR